MKKRMIVTTAAALCLAAALGAARWFVPKIITENHWYSITQKQGRWFISAGPGAATVYPISSVSVHPKRPRYTTVEEMYDQIANSNFTVADLRVPLSENIFPDQQNMEILRLDRLREPVPPEGSQFANVFWGGDYCRFYFTGDLERSTLAVFTRDDYQWFVDEYTKFLSGAQTTEPERNAAVFRSETDEFTVLCYELSTANGNFYVLERFDGFPEDFSTAVPYKVTMCGNQDGNYVVWCFDTTMDPQWSYRGPLQERPSVELLTKLAEIQWK